MAGGLIVICFAVETVRFPHKGYAGFGAVAEKVLQDAPAKTARYLVSSDARGEGMFIAEMAVREKRPGHTVERATKKLANSDWSGFGYQLTYRKKQTDTSGTPYHDARELSDLLAADGIEYIVLDESMPAKSRPAHEQMLADALALGSSAYSLQATFPLERAGGFFPKALKVYQLKRINQ